MKKRHSTVLQNARGQKNKHSHWKNISGLKNSINSYEKRHSTVLQNARGQKNKHSHWKNSSGLKNPINSYEKTAQHRPTKCPRPKKTNTLIEKIILVLKAIKIHMKKRHSTVLQNAWNQKNKHSHWKNNSGLKNSINSYEKTAQHRPTKCPRPKKQTLSLKKQFWS